MRLVGSLSWAFAVLGLLFAGCQEVATSPDTVQLVRAVVDEFTGEAIEGVVICETGTDNCVVTDANGRAAALELPANENVSWTYDGDEYGSVLAAAVLSGPVNEGTSTMFPDSYLVDQSSRVETLYPPTNTGMIFVFLSPLSFAGATFELLGATNKRYYTDEDWSWSLDLTETVSRTEPVSLPDNHGDAVFVEVPPGRFRIEAGGTGEACSVGFGWPGDEANRLETLVLEGFITYAVFNCPPP